MPHFLNTPEALLGRNDSKNPSTTCKGLTSSGRPCRRALASPRSSSVGRRKDYSALGGLVALTEEDGEVQGADFYCWQHKEQAEEIVQGKQANAGPRPGEGLNRRGTELYQLKERSSIDTMVQKLGLDAVPEKARKKRTKNPTPPRRTQTIDFALSPSQAPYGEKYNLGGASMSSKPRPKRPGFWASLCCMTGDDDDYVEIVRHKKRVEQPHMSQATPTTAVPSRKPLSSSPNSTTAAAAPQTRTDSGTETGTLLSLTPDHLSPSTASALLAELTKPISPTDEEGYIYIFWLTPQSKTAPTESTARSLLAPPGSAHRPSHGRRISDVMTEFSFDGDEDASPHSRARGGVSSHKGSDKRTIMLKIGRANNITRRMNEWQRQCGYAMSLIRWYPYVSSSPRGSPQHERQPLYPDLSRPTGNRRHSSGDQVHKVPCVKRVERLIHLELAEKQVKRQCAACGKEHREWFEVEASQAGVEAVDQVVRRWVGWGEKQEVD